MEKVLLYQSLIFLVIFGAWLCMAPVTSSSSLTYSKFVIQKSNRIGGVTRLGPPWTSEDEVTCVRECKRKYQDCMSIMFNEQTGLCTPAHKLNKSEPFTTPDEGRLYATFCDSSKGFQLRPFNGTDTCLKLVKNNTDYAVANAYCQSMDAFMMSVKTKNKLQIVLSVLADSGLNSNLWTGCDGLDWSGSGVYAWKEDNETFTFATKPTDVFVSSQPDNPGNEPCIVLESSAGSSKLLSSWPCTNLQLPYMCETYLPPDQ